MIKKTNILIRLSIALGLGVIATQSGYCFYSASTGRWLSRDPLLEKGGLNIHSFVDNDPVRLVDFLGCDITCCSPDGYFKGLGLMRDTHYTKSGDVYKAKAGAVFNPGTSTEKLIVWRMLLAKHNFKAKGNKLSELQAHIDARIKIVNRALAANFQAIGRDRLTSDDWKEFKRDPDGYFDRINGTGRAFGCEVIALIIFQSANQFVLPEEIRAYDGVWIPGDWGYIRNKTFEQHREKYPKESGDLWKGENVFHVGISREGKPEDVFWGAYEQGVHAARTESQWFNDIKDWPAGGDPVWRNKIKAPGMGLDNTPEKVPDDL